MRSRKTALKSKKQERELTKKKSTISQMTRAARLNQRLKQKENSGKEQKRRVQEKAKKSKESVNQKNQGESHPPPSHRPPSPQALKQNLTTSKLKDLYENVENPPPFTAKIADFLRQNKIHSTHRRIPKKISPRRHIIVKYPKQIFMADLIDYQKISFHNKGLTGYFSLLTASQSLFGQFL